MWGLFVTGLFDSAARFHVYPHLSPSPLIGSRIPGYGYTVFYFLSSTDGDLGCFHFGAIMNSATPNIYGQVFCFHFSGAYA